MQVIKSSLFYVIKRFPDRKEDIRRFYKKNNTFRAICEDYRVCAEALKGWNASASDQASARGKEYAELLSDLEAELQEILDTPK